MSVSNPYRLARGWTEALRAVRRQRSVILGYHGVQRCRRTDDVMMLQLDPARFRGQIRMFVAAGFEFVTVAELARRADGGVPPPGLAAVSFDDGLRNNLTTALPILNTFDVPATVYVPSGWIGRRNPWIAAGAGNETVSKDELRQLASAGWEIGSHTVDHADLATLDYAGCRDQIERDRIALQTIVRKPVETLAYPYGRYAEAAIAAAKDAGLRAAVTTGSGSWEPFELTRAMMGAADPFAVSMLKITDRYEPMLRTPPLPLVRAASKRLRQRLGQRRVEPERPA
jgi:peptidoglycan/xylan/chitin deacetylase (PgdA/CDA1 family)